MLWPRMISMVWATSYSRCSNGYDPNESNDQHHQRNRKQNSPMIPLPVERKASDVTFSFPSCVMHAYGRRRAGPCVCTFAILDRLSIISLKSREGFPLGVCTWVPLADKTRVVTWTKFSGKSFSGVCLLPIQASLSPHPMEKRGHRHL